jgi:diguanylate cyclase (GGDEF)-like protein
VREGDVVGRFGGDEFVVVCQETEKDEAEGIAERLRAALQEQFPDLPPWFAITVSIGVVVFQPDPQRETTTDELLALAVDEMYRAKNGGRNRVSVLEV